LTVSNWSQMKVADSHFLIWMTPVDIPLTFSLVFGSVTVLVSYSTQNILAFASPTLVAFSLEIIYEILILCLSSIFLLNNPSLEELLCEFFASIKGELICSMTIDNFEIAVFAVFCLFCLFCFSRCSVFGVLCSVLTLSIMCQKFENTDVITMNSNIDSLGNNDHAISRYCNKMSLLICSQIILEIIYAIIICAKIFVYFNRDSTDNSVIWFIFINFWRLFTGLFSILPPILQLVLIRNANRSSSKLHWLYPYVILLNCN